MHRHLSLITSMHLQHSGLRNAIGRIQALYAKLLGRNSMMKRRGDLPGAGAEGDFLSLNH